MQPHPYIETFDYGPGGWLDYHDGMSQPEIRDGVFIARGPWWIDYNHAPPGGGYLHLLAVLHTHESYVNDKTRTLAGDNRFVAGGFSRDLTNARLTVRLRGNVDLQGAQLVLLAQGDLPHTRVNYVLTGQPFEITPDWSEQTVTLTPDPDQWRCLGSRHDRTDLYGCGEIADLLRDVNCDLILVLFPLTIVPLTPIDDLHTPRAGLDYAVDQSALPNGVVEFDTIRIDYPNAGGR
jgi:hypothetical protein